MSAVATLLPGVVRLQRLRAAMGHLTDFVPCDDWQTLTRLCASTPVRVAVVDFCMDGQVSFEELRIIRRRFPRTALVAYVELPPVRPRDLFDAGRFGFVGLLVRDVDDDPASIAVVLERATMRSLAAILARSLGGLVPLVRDATLRCVTHGHEELTPASLARALMVSRRHLAERLHAAGFPAPRRLITWGRLMTAADLLEHTRSSGDGVAASLGFPSGSAFRNTCQRYLQATPRQLAARGGAAFVVHAFLRQVGRVEAGGRARQGPVPTRSPT